MAEVLLVLMHILQSYAILIRAYFQKRRFFQEIGWQACFNTTCLFSSVGQNTKHSSKEQELLYNIGKINYDFFNYEEQYFFTTKNSI